MTWLLWAVGLWVVWAGALFLLQRRVIFPRHLVNPVTSPGRLSEGIEEVTLETPSGTPGKAYFLAASDSAAGSAPAIIFAHGNAELARDWAGAYRSLAREGVAVLLVEYPGYGDAPGSPSLESIGEVMVAGFDHLAERPRVDSTRIVGLGRSLGGGAVTELASRRPLAGLVLQSTFTRVRDFTKRFLVPSFLVRDPFDNLAVVEAFGGPVLVLHGRRDGVIPYDHGQALAEAAGVELVTWSCGHNDCPPDWTGYVERVAGFVKGVASVEHAGPGEPTETGG